MADEKIEKKLKPEIVAKASPDMINPELPKSTASEEDWAATIERHTIAEFQESEDEEEV
jgi:hypothetical protein